MKNNNRLEADQLEVDQLDKAINKAHYFIGYRPRSVKEVEDRLCRYGFDSEIRAKVIDRLLKDGVLNDKEFAWMWADNRADSKKFGPAKIRNELYRKGIAPELIDETIETVYAQHNIHELAADFLHRKYRQKIDEIDDKKKIDVLVRNGYSYSVASDVVKESKGDST